MTRQQGLDHNASDPVVQWLKGLADEADQDDEEANEKAKVLCKRCSHLITRVEHLIPIHGESDHFFVNPNGCGFDIQTYQHASGCILAGAITDYFSWFQGFSWQYCFCGNCNEHLGWHYSCEGVQGFYGLVIDRLKLE